MVDAFGSDALAPTTSLSDSADIEYQPSEDGIIEFVEEHEHGEWLEDPESESENEDEDISTLSEKVGNEKLTDFCRALDRANVSIRNGALLATTMAFALGHKTIFDRNKIDRARRLTRIEAKAAYRCPDLLKCIFLREKRKNFGACRHSQQISN